jgi:hypothetical protein
VGRARRQQQPRHLLVDVVAGHGTQRLDRLQVHGQGVGRTNLDGGIGQSQPLGLRGDALGSGPGGIQIPVVEQRVD